MEVLEKTKIMSVVNSLPDTVEMDAFFDRIILMAKVEKGLQQIADGNSYSQDEVEKIAKGWFNDNSLTK
jgi:predicted transcriptional regulator